MMKDPDWICIWRSLALTLIDCGYLSLEVLQKEAVKRRWKGSMIAEVANALNVEAFEHGHLLEAIGEGSPYRAPSGLLGTKRSSGIGRNS